ncbi:MAG: PaaI family thioesterase [Chitinophagales bacterium]
MDIEAFKQSFSKANFINELGCKLIDIGNGTCEIHLPIQEKLWQQNGFVHAGVLATLADHVAGCAAYTVAKANTKVLTSEFKINLMRPAIGQKLIAKGKVLKPGKLISVCLSEVYASNDGIEKLVAIALVSITNVE